MHLAEISIAPEEYNNGEQARTVTRCRIRQPDNTPQAVQCYPSSLFKKMHRLPVDHPATLRWRCPATKHSICSEFCPRPRMKQLHVSINICLECFTQLQMGFAEALGQPRRIRHKATGQCGRLRGVGLARMNSLEQRAFMLVIQNVLQSRMRARSVK